MEEYFRDVYKMKSIHCHRLAIFVQLIMLILLLQAKLGVSFDSGLSNDDLIVLGNSELSAGNYETAARHFEDALETYLFLEPELQIEILTNLAKAYQFLGYFELSSKSLGKALFYAENSNDIGQFLKVYSSLGQLHTYMGNYDEAEKYLQKGLSTAAASEIVQAIIVNLLNLAELQAIKGKAEESFSYYKQAILHSRKIDDINLLSLALTNAASSAYSNEKFDQAQKWNYQALAMLPQVKDTRKKGHLMITVGTTFQKLSTVFQEKRDELTYNAYSVYKNAVKIADRVSDTYSKSYAFGYMGELLEKAGQLDEALKLSRKALQLAQTEQLPDAVFRWQWQVARILKEFGNLGDAIRVYRGALSTLKTIRHDLIISHENRNLKWNFREAIGPIYFELIDCLIEQYKFSDDNKMQQVYLHHVQEIVEQFQEAELEDYFLDDCQNIAKQNQRRVDSIIDETAVIQIIPLREQLNILVSVKDQNAPVEGTMIYLFFKDVKSKEVNNVVRTFRQYLEIRPGNKHLENAQKLYKWIIDPIKPILLQYRIKTLIFIPDLEFRTIPMAALHDGKQYLIQNFAIAISPGLHLLDPHTVNWKKARCLVTGSDRKGSGTTSLKFVAEEIANVRKYIRSETLLNDAFTLSGFSKIIAKNQFKIIHIASHGKFSGIAEESYIQTYDGKLSLNDLERAIKPSAYRGIPIELLVLSACETAAGNDRSALGLAGVAIKSGARSVFGTLWNVDDKSTSLLIDRFYKKLIKFPRAHDQTISKAQALQSAQKYFIEQDQYRYGHPCFWAPFQLIGNWL